MKTLLYTLFCLLMVSNNLVAQSALEENIAAGEQYLKNNAERKSVVSLPSGLQYEILEEGSGEQPTINSSVKTHYHGTLIDGSVFDSSVDKGKPATFPVNRVIKGWQEAIPLMKVGAKYRLYIPHHLAYGTRDMPKIPAGSVLIFNVALLEIVK